MTITRYNKKFLYLEETKNLTKNKIKIKRVQRNVGNDPFNLKQKSLSFISKY